MAKKDETVVNVRLPLDLIERLDDLAVRMTASPDAAIGAFGNVTRSAALRAALLAGLPVVERRFPKVRRGR